MHDTIPKNHEFKTKQHDILFLAVIFSRHLTIFSKICLVLKLTETHIHTKSTAFYLQTNNKNEVNNVMTKLKKSTLQRGSY